MSQFNDERIQQKVDEVKRKFEERIAKIQEEGNRRIKKITDDSPDPNAAEAVLNATFEIKSKITSIKFDVPKFSMEREILKFDVPEVKMELKSIKFDVPATRMVRTCLFKKPEFKSSGFPPRITVKWTCVWGDKPEVYMKTIEIKTDIPRFTSKRVEIIFDKPVVKMETVEIKLHLPQFYVKELSGQFKEQEREVQEVGQELTAEIAKVESEMQLSLQAEVAAEIEKMDEGMREDLMKERNSVCKYYDEAIAKTKAAIKILKENNAIGEVANMEKELSKMVKDYQNILADIDKGLQACSISLSESFITQ